MNFYNPLGPNAANRPPSEPPPPPEKPERKSVFMYNEELDKIAVYLIGSQQRFRENIIIPRSIGGGYIKTNEEKAIESFMESCAFKSIMSCVLGKSFIFSLLINSQYS